MKKLPESPLSLPIKTKISFPKRNVLIDNLILMPTDNCTKLYDFLINYFKNKNDEIVEFKENAYFFLLRNGNNLMDNQFKIEKENKIISTGLMPGETIYFTGDICLKSEAKKNCFTYDFDKIKIQQIINYFSCEKCNLNWICQECANACHKGHSIKLFREKHVATWACCYCYKNNCSLKNKYN